MRWTRRIVGAGVVAGVAWALWRRLDRPDRTLEWQPQPFPLPPQPVPVPPATPEPAAPEPAAPQPAAPEPATPAWVAPTDGTCPATHPVKAKVRSGIFHLPGGEFYDRTVPDRCYGTPAGAEADGLRAAKR